jgi:hypothetical protein
VTGLERATLLCILAGPAGLAGQAPPPQDVLTYGVRVLDRGWPAPPVAPDELPGLPVDGYPTIRVIHGPRLTWVVDAGRTPSLASARLFLEGHETVMPGPGSLLLRGWDAASDSGTVVDLELVRGSGDRDIAGRRAEHYTVLATVERAGGASGGRSRYDVTAHLWVLRGLPFTWAPFTTDRAALPWRFPELRDPVRQRIEPLGLVARAMVAVEESPRTGSGSAPATREVAGFEIAELGRTRAPPVPGVVVDRDIAEALQRLADRRPRQVCAAARAGDLPGVIESRVDLVTRSSLLGFLDGYCAGRRSE